MIILFKAIVILALVFVIVPGAIYIMFRKWFEGR
jgi:subtilase family serine protease